MEGKGEGEGLLSPTLEIRSSAKSSGRMWDRSSLGIQEDAWGQDKMNPKLSWKSRVEAASVVEGTLLPSFWPFSFPWGIKGY